MVLCTPNAKNTRTHTEFSTSDVYFRSNCRPRCQFQAGPFLREVPRTRRHPYWYGTFYWLGRTILRHWLNLRWTNPLPFWISGVAPGFQGKLSANTVSQRLTVSICRPECCRKPKSAASTTHSSRQRPTPRYHLTRAVTRTLQHNQLHFMIYVK